MSNYFACSVGNSPVFLTIDAANGAKNLMNTDEQIAYIIHHLTEGDDPKDLVFDLCQQTNLTWPQAEALVRQVQEEKQGDIARKQFPLLFILALGAFVIGLGLIGYSVYSVIAEMALVPADPLNGQLVEQNIDGVSRLYLFFSLVVRSGGQIITLFVLGIAMVLGSLLGMRDTWVKILSNR
jgi:hypothetical protein